MDGWMCLCNVCMYVCTYVCMYVCSLTLLSVCISTTTYAAKVIHSPNMNCYLFLPLVMYADFSTQSLPLMLSTPSSAKEEPSMASVVKQASEQ